MMTPRTTGVTKSRPANSSWRRSRGRVDLPEKNIGVPPPGAGRLASGPRPRPRRPAACTCGLARLELLPGLSQRLIHGVCRLFDLRLDRRAVEPGLLEGRPVRAPDLGAV